MRDMKKTTDKVAASVTVYQVADMTTKGRKAVCGWLRKLADDLQREPESFAKTFRARYLYSPNPKVLRSPLGGDMEQPVVGGA